MSDVTRRIARWEVKCTPERTKATLDAIRENMKERYEFENFSIQEPKP